MAIRIDELFFEVDAIRAQDTSEYPKSNDDVTHAHGNNEKRVARLTPVALQRELSQQRIGTRVNGVV